MAPIKVVLGGGIFMDRTKWTPRDVSSFLDGLAECNIREIDSAQRYDDCETVLGEASAGNRFDIATKIPGIIVPGSFRKVEVVRRTEESLRRLKVAQVDILYLHTPDPSIPIQETLAGLQELYVAGAFRRFGISNFSTADVQRIYDHQVLKGWVLPTVYQGMYNPLARQMETSLLPTLRKLGIAFYAFSPTAGGFLAKTQQQVVNGVGRFSKDGGDESIFFNKMYNRPSMLMVLELWQEIARSIGISPHSLALRWTAYHSALKPEKGDAMVLGVHNITQLRENVSGLAKGVLDLETVERINSVWEDVRISAPVVDASFITRTMEETLPSY